MSQIKVQNSLPKQYTTQHTSNKQQSFKGLGDFVTSGLQLCDQYPMVGVSVVDLTSTIIPRTAVDAQTGPAAALETLRRESSGLIVNCLTPSLFVLGMSKLLNKPIMKDFKGIDMSSSWLNEDSLEKLTGIYAKTKDPESYVRETLNSLEGLSGNEFVKFSDKLSHEDCEKAVKLLTEEIKNPGANKEFKKPINKAYEYIVGQTKAGETIRFIGDVDPKTGEKKLFSSNLSDLLRDKVDLGRKLYKHPEILENPETLKAFKKSALSLINKKSIAGLAIIFPLAMSMQAINRAITRKKYKTKGAPIYKDFGKGKVQKEMTAKQKTEFFGLKCLAAAGMVGLAITSMMKKPNMKMFQFKGMFPTVDQTRWIATATIASRFFASEDKNELREAVVRDTTVFAGLYFLGDYVAKTAAMIMEKANSKVKLINRLDLADDTKAKSSKLWNWVKNHKLKSFDEVADKGTKNMRSYCQVANIGFSILVLGLLIPFYNRYVTNKKIQKEKELESAPKTETKVKISSGSFQGTKTPKAFSGFEKVAN